MSTTIIETAETSFIGEVVNDVVGKITSAASWVAGHFWSVCEATVVVAVEIVDRTRLLITDFLSTMRRHIAEVTEQVGVYFGQAAQHIFWLLGELFNVALAALIIMAALVMLAHILPVLVVFFLLAGTVDLIERLYNRVAG